ncbi:MAG: hypothetical protein H0W04_04970 [Chthoniobacterales bacterium]|nr:hypothetical protein [Chthoniobacterales bacterium]
MEQLRHRLTHVSPQGRCCSVDQNTLKRSDLDDFVACYNPKNRHDRTETERFKSFTYEELIKRDKRPIACRTCPTSIGTLKFSVPRAVELASLPALSSTSSALKTKAFEDSANLPDPGVIALEIVEDFEVALAEFAEIAADLNR